MFNSIVVAFDGSKLASRALEIGADQARQQKASLGIIYVIDNAHMHIPENMRKMSEVEHILEPSPRMHVNIENAPATMISSMAQTSADSQDAMFRYADFLLGQAADHVKKAGVAEVECKVALGDPAEEIVDFANARKADLIISGSRGVGKLKRLLLGSVSRKLTQLAECSCLTVR